MEFKKAERKKFIAFRTGFIYWAGQKIRLPKSNVEDFGKRVKNPVFIYENDSYTICFCHTGLIMLHIVGLETEEDEVLHAYEEIWELEEEFDKHKKAGDENGVKQVAARAEALLGERKKLLPNIDSEIARFERYLHYVNSLYFVLTSLRGKLTDASSWSTPPIGILDTSRFIIRDGEFGMYSYENIIVTNRVFEEYKSTSPNQWSIIPQATFDVINQMFSIVASRPRLAERLSQILKASNEYENHNFSYGLLLAWLIIESVLMDKWEEYLRRNTNTTTGRKRIGKERTKALTGRDYPVSVILNFLELSNELTLDQYVVLDNLRKIRNKVIHGEKHSSCTESDCKRAIQSGIGVIYRRNSFETRMAFWFACSVDDVRLFFCCFVKEAGYRLQHRLQRTGGMPPPKGMLTAISIMKSRESCQAARLLLNQAFRFLPMIKA